VALLAVKQDDDGNVKAFVPTYRKAFSRQNFTQKKGEDGRADILAANKYPQSQSLHCGTAPVPGVECQYPSFTYI
jgi:hypothetical protein